MFRFLKEFAIYVLIVITASGCAGTKGGRDISKVLSGTACMAMYTVGGAAVGAAAGAAVGAAAGAIADGKEGAKDGAKKGAGYGAAGGAVLGFAYAWGKCLAYFSEVTSEPVMDYSETAKAVHYNPVKGADLKINKYTANPNIVAPGNMIALNADYYVLTPDGQKEVTVEETRILKVLNPQTMKYEECGRVTETITAAQGLRNASGQFPIQSDTPEGQYMIELLIASQDRTDSASIPFAVTNRSEILAKAQSISKGHAINVSSAKTMTYASGIKTVAERKIVTVAIEKATLRRGPDKASTKIASVKRGDKFEFIKEETIAGKKWYEVRLENGETAWIIANTSTLTEE